MLTLTSQDITLRASASSKEQALQLVAEKMVDGGLVKAGYLAALLAREKQISTYLGQGIAIPHGTAGSKSDVLNTGICVVQFPQGVDWGDGQIANIVVGIAAKSEEHLTILQRLTHVISDEQAAAELKDTTDAGLIAAILNGQQPSKKLQFDRAFVHLQQPLSSVKSAASIAMAKLLDTEVISWEFANHLPELQPRYLAEGVWLMGGSAGVNRSAVAAVQLAESNTLKQQPFKFLVLFAAVDRQHEQVIQRLLKLQQKGALSQLTNAVDTQEVVRLLSCDVVDGKHITVTVLNADGLHARPAAQLVKSLENFDCQISVEPANHSVLPINARSLTQLLSLGVVHGQELVFTAQGPQADEALKTVEQGFREGLGEPTVPVVDKITEQPKTQHEEKTVLTTGILQGVGAAQGIAIAPMQLHIHQLASSAIDDAQHFSPTEEIPRLQYAIDAARQQLGKQLERLTQEDLVAILSVHRDMLEDPELSDRAEQLMRMGHQAEWSWQQSFTKLADVQAALANPLLAQRAADIRDVGERVLQLLIKRGEASSSQQEPHIWVTDELLPSTLVEMDPTLVKGIATAFGGTNSHAAILARSLGIPLVVGLGEALLTLETPWMAILDGDKGLLEIAPEESRIQHARQSADLQKKLEAKALASCQQQAITQDQHIIEVAGNIANLAEAEKTVEMGGEAVGLLRTEFVFMHYATEPTEAQQQQYYQQIIQALAGRPLVARCLDVGGDKPLPFLPQPKEENPFLGVRGIRLTLQYPHILEKQLSALMAAAGDQPLRIMFPMVTDIAEWYEIKAIAKRIQAKYNCADLQLGIMIEVPAAALLAEHFASEVDFFSIGTNDLSQYTLAMDRGHPKLSARVDPLHPAVLQLIKRTVEGARHGKAWVGVCGEMAADTAGLALLLGLGVDEVSVSSKAIPRTKLYLRHMSFKDCQQLVERALSQSDAKQVRKIAGDYVESVMAVLSGEQK
ncbi:phosphoenolpyruvate--protein phosphotransferase [Zooshikella harenae]|uniref:phosphoenolpyruvate--protein phosphotransferase n=1 Tax=Zooshikella harenae TaxID=2827238 RepID=A0ABS5Z9Q4_9GAMM|nr:phosphoenolpyruvate--protein phosphotransferase [Zooshikella harenae]MBU2710781.1 phosphoenolpyruvate--protein phosphotransferase [Zooshikella harenae]